jgi:hypothetical protein
MKQDLLDPMVKSLRSNLKSQVKMKESQLVNLKIKVKKMEKMAKMKMIMHQKMVLKHQRKNQLIQHLHQSQ